MEVRRFSKSVAHLLRLAVVLSLGFWICAADLSFSYLENVGNFVPLESQRLKRQAAERLSQILQPTIVEKQTEKEEQGLTLINESDWRNATVNTTSFNYNHIYYELITNDPTLKELNERWIDAEDLLKSGKATGHAEHPQLSSSYRRAVNIAPKFAMPFYGHTTDNLTLATGGFCYVGDHMHSWLAATQYIAPLMANFETTREESGIIYADTGKMMVVEWKKVYLRHQAEHGAFTFQVQMYENGDIWFLYKEVPVRLEAISDAHHPRKVGLSDAYLFHHNFPESDAAAVPFGKSKRVIYEYHRVEVDLSMVVTNRVIQLKAKDTCIALKTCNECMNATLDHFVCNWCPLKDGHSFCSDTQGFHRRRQEWLNGSCKEQKSLAYCLDSDKEIDRGPAPKPPPVDPPHGGHTPPPPPPPRRNPEGSSKESHESEVVIVTNKPKTESGKEEKGAMRKEHEYSTKQRVTGDHSLGSGGVVAVLFIVATVLGLGGWIVYAYYNPHTTSGQFLIRYRPTRWRFPGDHGDVRYTASVHM